jgi:ubiquinone/menaquinone biosynthesis C-methylase UbiE
MEKEQFIQKFNKQADKYAKQRKHQEKNKWRKKIFGSAWGKTLEVAVGAGMNFAFYPPTIEYIGVDFSPEMIEKAKEAANEYNIHAEFILSDVESLSFPDNFFDTIVSSGSLCGYKNPLKVLNFLINGVKKMDKSCFWSTVCVLILHLHGFKNC